MPLKCFISYAAAERSVAAEVRDALAELGVQGFLAHDDIAVSQVWRDRILEELRTADVFVPLLSAAFKASDWTSQEIGVAVSRPEVLILPIRLERAVIPYGFIAHIQGTPRPLRFAADFFWGPLVVHRPREIIGARIDRLRAAPGWRMAEALMQPLEPLFASLTDTEVNALADAAIGNNQVWDAGDCANRALPAFIQLNRDRISPDRLKALEYQITRRTWYPYGAEDDEDEAGQAGGDPSAGSQPRSEPAAP